MKKTRHPYTAFIVSNFFPFFLLYKGTHGVDSVSTVTPFNPSTVRFETKRKVIILQWVVAFDPLSSWWIETSRESINACSIHSDDGFCSAPFLYRLTSLFLLKTNKAGGGQKAFWIIDTFHTLTFSVAADTIRRFCTTIDFCDLYVWWLFYLENYLPRVKRS